MQPSRAAVASAPEDTINYVNYPSVSNDGPTIGIDIGLPTPARKINPNSANQTRSLLVIAIAVAAVIGVILLAVLISNLGGDSKTPQLATATVGKGTVAPTSTLRPTATPRAVGSATPAAGAGAGTASVPDVRNETPAGARQVLEAAGYVVSEVRSKSNQQKNTIIDQSPGPDTPLEPGLKVTIVISDGP